MKNAKSLLDSLMAAKGGSSTGKGGSLTDLAAQAKGMLGSQSGTTKTLAGGSLLAVLMGGKKRRKSGGGSMKLGGAAIIGALAYRAWQDWQAGKAATAEPGSKALPSPEGTPFLPAEPAAADDLATRLLQAMVAAAKADGHVTPEERQRIQGQLDELGLEDEAGRLIAAELDAPLDVGRIAALARTPEEGAEIYAASLLVVDPDAPAEKGYLSMLAARLGLQPDLVAHLHAREAELD